MSSLDSTESHKALWNKIHAFRKVQGNMVRNTGLLNLVCETTRNRTSILVQIPELVIGMWCFCTSNLTM